MKQYAIGVFLSYFIYEGFAGVCLDIPEDKLK